MIAKMSNEIARCIIKVKWLVSWFSPGYIRFMKHLPVYSVAFRRFIFAGVRCQLRSGFFYFERFRNKKTLLCTCLFILSSLACSSAIRISSVIDLPPPTNVRHKYGDELIKISWNAGPEQDVLNFKGYLLYFSNRSLATVPFSQLPAPVEISARTTEFNLAVSDSLPVFVHVRSRAGHRKISLPSLPELIIHGSKLQNGK